MGVWVNAITGAEVTLRASHVLGRSAERSDTVLDDPNASRLHAEVRWRGRGWFIADHSQNGTWVDGVLLERGPWTSLRLGNHVRFGPGSTSQWRVVSVAPPRSSLEPVDRAREVILLGSHELPRDLVGCKLPEFCRASNAWLHERDGAIHTLIDGELIMLGGFAYRAHLVDAVLDTHGEARPPVSPALLRFCVSADEEHTQLRVALGRRELDLGERIHHYCLVTLARRRLADARAGFDASAQGWIDCGELAAMLKIDLQHLNIQVHRARNQLLAELPDGTQLALVERQRGCLRLGEIAFEIVRGGEREGHYTPNAGAAIATSDAAGAGGAGRYGRV